MARRGSKKNRPEDFDRVNAFYQSEIMDIEKEFPRRVYSSYIVNWYSTYEDLLLSMCKALGLNLVIQPFDRMNITNGLERARKILEQTGFKTNEDDLREIRIIRDIRNKLAHNSDNYQIGGEPEKNDLGKFQLTNFVEGVNLYVQMDKATFRYFDRYKLLELHRGYGRINPGYPYCEHLIKFANRSIHKTITDIEKNQPELKQF